MRLFSYVVARDFGFAPNPFFGFCTLATCKPKIRAVAKVNDWVIGTGSANYGLQGHLVYAMRVTEVLSFDEYWLDPRFLLKRPNMRGSRKQAFGDNIYHHGAGNRWLQENSHHSLASGQPNRHNIEHDTQTPRILVSDDWVYHGHLAPKILDQFRNSRGADICIKNSGHKCKFDPNLVGEFLNWIRSANEHGYRGSPSEFPR